MQVRERERERRLRNQYCIGLQFNAILEPSSITPLASYIYMYVCVWPFTVLFRSNAELTAVMTTTLLIIWNIYQICLAKVVY